MLHLCRQKPMFQKSKIQSDPLFLNRWRREFCSQVPDYQMPVTQLDTPYSARGMRMRNAKVLDEIPSIFPGYLVRTRSFIIFRDINRKCWHDHFVRFVSVRRGVGW